MTDILFRSIDLETTSREKIGEVIEVGFTDVWFTPETKAVRVEDRHHASLYSPTKPMSADNMGVHHITMRDLRNHAPFTAADEGLLVEGGPFAFVAANCAFEQQFILPFARWICTEKVSRRLVQDSPDFKNQTMRYHLGLDLDAHWAMPPHRAGPDSFVTAHIFAKLLAKASVSDMVRWTNEPKLMLTCPLGKHRGEAWPTVPHSFLTWILGKDDFDEDLKWNVRAELERRREAQSAHTRSLLPPDQGTAHEQPPS